MRSRLLSEKTHRGTKVGDCNTLHLVFRIIITRTTSFVHDAVLKIIVKVYH